MEIDKSREYAINDMKAESIVHYIQNKYMQTVSNKEIYHYTNISGFMGIMQSKELWATNTDYLNDKMECRQAWQDCIKIVEGTLVEKTARNNILPLEVRESIEDEMKSKIDNIYSISFCEEGDLLSQWRGYGGKGGISIGFTVFEDSKDVIGEKRPNLYSVIYDMEECNTVLKDIVDIACENENRHKYTVADETANYYKNMAKSICDVVRYIAPVIKNKGFREEKEIRYIWRDDQSRTIYFREKNGIIVPYIKCGLEDSKNKELSFLVIDDIIVGPQVNQIKVADSIKFYLDRGEYKNLVDKVRMSETPYRE